MSKWDEGAVGLCMLKVATSRDSMKYIILSTGGTLILEHRWYPHS